MAVLLIWWQHDGRPIDERVWAQMRACAALAAPCFADQAFQSQTSDYRALALRSHASEPDPLRVLADSSLALHASWRAPSDAELRTCAPRDPGCVIHFDPAERCLSLSVDPLGHRRLVWGRVPGGLLAASSEELLLCHPGVDRRINRRLVAGRACFLPAGEEDTTVLGLNQVAPGLQLRATPSTEQRTWLQFEPDPNAWTMTARRASEHFRGLLEAATVSAVRGTAGAAISLSSGLDSGSVAACWVAAGRPGSGLHAINYGYKHPGEVDERPLSAALAQRFDLGLTQVDVAETPPLTGWAEQASPWSFPEFEPYRALSEAVCMAARVAAADVVLTGSCADHIGHGQHRWATAAASSGDWAQLTGGYLGLLRSQGPRALWRERGWRWIVGRALRRPVRFDGWHPPAWIGPELAEELLTLRQTRRERLAHWPDQERAEFHLHSLHSAQLAMWLVHSMRTGLDFRHPFRDRELLRFLLSLPMHRLCGPGDHKQILRQAMTDRLPDRWRLPAKRGMLGPFLRRELKTHWPAMRQRLNGAEWQEWIAPERGNRASPPGWWDPAWRAFQLQLWFDARRSEALHSSQQRIHRNAGSFAQPRRRA